MSKRKPTSSQPGIDRYFCKSRRTESQVDEGEKTASDSDRQTPAILTTSNLGAPVDENGKTAGDVGDRQTPAIPTTSDSAARVDESEKTADNSDRQTPAIPTTSNSAACVDEGDKTAESTNNHPLLSQLQCEALIKEFFTQGKLQNYYTCFKKCSKLTEQGLRRIKPKSFNHDWVEKLDNWWLCYVEGKGMFCIICKKQGVTNPQNKTDKFSGVASDRFKSDAIETHRKSGRHKSALEVEMISIMSVFHKEFVEKKETEISFLEKAFSTAYFVMKEYLPNRKFFLPINLITNLIRVAEIKYFQHRSEGSLTEIVLTIGNVVKELNLKKIRAASCFGLMTDEMTDVSVTSQLITFVQYFCTQSETVETSFLSAQNVLKEHDAATVQAIYDLLKEELLSSQLGIKKFDGAGNRWCICHDTNYIQDVFGLLRQTWKHFENSPKRMALLMKLLTNVNEVRVSSTKGKKVLAKKLKKACKTRWLSFDRSVEAMKQQYCGVIQSLQELDSIHNDATAAGLLKKMKNAEFIGALYYISIGTKQNLNRIVEDDIPMDKLQADVDSFTNLGCDITFPPTSYQQMQSLTQKNIAALSNNLDQRFLSSSDVISALSIFDPVNVPAYEADGFQEYGHSSVNILAKHFFQIETEVQKLKSEKLLAEWSHMKYHVNDNIKKMIPIEVKSGSIVVSLPVSNAWPERGASAVKNVKTRLRSRLQNDMLQGILAVGINGPGVQSCLPVVKKAARVWLEAKERRKLSKVPKSENPTSEPSLVIVQCETKEMGVQCEREETIAVQSGTAADREHE
ncbi:Zinc finger protein 862 [Stylophora pistillata]|uniref:Zinc finger protein 862 n=1 Tax=Stylophora pistillata TaxID=50429 RepID=A0A2B4S7E3_STYPI|nr:Zinc finger protein 862 [Stylophora pistillata]